MKIIIAMRSLWACKILNGDKKIEVRKGLALYNALKKAEEKGEEVEFLMYATKDKPLIRLESLFGGKIKYDVDLKRNRNAYSETLDGKVVARFKADADILLCGYSITGKRQSYRCFGHSINYMQLGYLEGTCLDYRKLDDYLKGEQGTALRIRDLEIFDKPKTLADYGLKRAPQSWCYAKEGD